MSSYNGPLELQFDITDSSDNCSSFLTYNQNTDSQLDRCYEDPVYNGVSVESRPDGIVHNYDNVLGLQGYESSDNESWRSGTSLYSQDADFRPDRYYEDEDPVCYGIRPSGKYQSSITDIFRRDWNKIANTERNMRFEENGLWRVCQNAKMSQFSVQFPVEVFERDPKIFPWSGYIFDIASFGYWIYRCAGKIEILCNLVVATKTYKCLYNLGLNEQKANTLSEKMYGISKEKLCLWLRKCSEFMALLNDRVHLCYGRLPPGEIEGYPGFFIAESLFGDQDYITWMDNYRRAVDRFNQKFANDFKWQLDKGRG